MRASFFERYIGIDYSGAATADSGVSGVRVYEATRDSLPVEVVPDPGARGYWTRRGLAGWLIKTLEEGGPVIVGIDHSFSFPLSYFEMHGLTGDWAAFLEDFRNHWPSDRADITIDMIRRGEAGNGSARTGNSRWRRIAEIRARAKSVFHFDVPGSVAKSTHAGLPWLLNVRERLGRRVHFWPYDGCDLPEGRPVVVEVYPSKRSGDYPREGRTQDQQDAYTAAAWMRRVDLDGTLEAFLRPSLTPDEAAAVRVEGWILGVL